MLITMLRQVSGTRDGVDWPAAGENLEVPDDEATSLIAIGLAKAAGETIDEQAPVDSRKAARRATAEPA